MTKTITLTDQQRDELRAAIYTKIARLETKVRWSKKIQRGGVHSDGRPVDLLKEEGICIKRLAKIGRLREILKLLDDESAD